jgi:hypothetical protein
MVLLLGAMSGGCGFGTTPDAIKDGGAQLADGASQQPSDARDATAEGGADEAVADNGSPTPTTLFDNFSVHAVDVTLDPTEWAAYLDGVDKPDGKKVYAWHKAQVVWDGAAYADVGVRGFGNGSQLLNPAKPNIRLKWDEFIPGADGPENIKSLRLKASGQDATFLREPLVFDLVRAVGGHAPRWSWARVRVNGVNYGIYQAFENADKRMFQSLFGNTDGHKYQTSEGCFGLDCPPWGCSALKSNYKGDPGDGSELVELAAAVAGSNDGNLLAELQPRIDVGALLANYATDAVVSNIDGLAASGQNFTFYVNTGTTLVEIIAGGTDLTLGNFDAWYAFDSPWGLPNSWCPGRVDQLYQRLWTAAATKTLLLEKFRALQCGAFRSDTLVLKIDKLRLLIKADVYADPKGVFSAGQLDLAFATLKAYVLGRQDALVALLGPCL